MAYIIDKVIRNNLALTKIHFIWLLIKFIYPTKVNNPIAKGLH